MLSNRFGNVGAFMAFVVQLEKSLVNSLKVLEIWGKSYKKAFLNQPHLKHA